MQNEVNICFLADDNYLMQTTVTISSLYINKNEDTIYNLFIILNGKSEEKIKRLKGLERNNFKISIIKIDRIKELLKFDIKEIPASPTAICKFYIPVLLKEIDKVLYIDGDTLIERDLLELYNIDIKDNYIGAVKDTCGLSRSLYRLFKKNVFYFNSGVMIMNLRKMREEDIPNKLMEYRINGYNHLMDQDALNYVLKGKVMELPFEYNTQLSCFEDVKRIRNTNRIRILREYFNIQKDIKNTDEIINMATILHYSGSLKPWNQAYVVEGDLWIYYYYNSPFKDVLLRKINKSKKKNSILSKLFKKIRRYNFMRNFIRNEEKNDKFKE